MSASFYDLMKYARTGIASPSMTHYDKVKAHAMFGGYPVNTITGVPPISFKAKGDALTDYSISGNMVQSGTPTTSDPIYPQECGDRTRNLVGNFGSSLEYRGVQYTVNADKSITAIGTASQGVSYFIFAGDGSQTNSINLYSTPIFKAGETLVFSTGSTIPIKARFTDGSYSSVSFKMNEPITLEKDVGLLYIQVVGGDTIDTTVYPMVNTGSTALPYEPYGYKLVLSCGGQTNSIYLSEPIRKIGDYADAVASNDSATRCVKKLVFDGTENWEKVEAGANSYVRLNVDDYKSGIPDLIICTHCVYTNITTTTTSYGCDYITSSSHDKDFIAFRLHGYQEVSEIQQFLADKYSAGTPVTVWYVLATPTTETVDMPQIVPTKGANTLTIDTTLQPSSVSITGHINQ